MNGKAETNIIIIGYFTIEIQGIAMSVAALIIYIFHKYSYIKSSLRALFFKTAISSFIYSNLNTGNV